MADPFVQKPAGSAFVRLLGSVRAVAEIEALLAGASRLCEVSLESVDQITKRHGIDLERRLGGPRRNLYHLAGARDPDGRARGARRALASDARDRARAEGVGPLLETSVSMGGLNWWSWGESNPRPSDCQPDALPAELQPHGRPSLPPGSGAVKASDAPRVRLDRPGGVVFFAAFGRSGGIGIRRALKMPRPHGRVGSSPTSGTHFGGWLE